jgi:hypothetical protein
VLAVNQMLATAAMPAGFLLAPVLLDAAAEPALRAAPDLARLLPADGGPALLLAGVGAALVVWAVLGLAYRASRHPANVRRVCTSAQTAVRLRCCP